MSTIAWKGPTTPLPMEINPRVVFERMFGRPGTAAERVARMQADREHPRLGAPGRGVARARARRRAIACGSISISTTCARSNSAFSVPRSRRPDELTVPDAPVGIPASFEEHVGVLFELMAVAYRGGPHARVHVHDEPRGQPAGVPESRRQRAVAPHLAPRQRAREARRAGQDQHLADRAVRAIPRSPGEDAGRRRLAARSLADSVRAAA